MRARSKAREVALHILYQIDISKKDHNLALKDYTEANPQPEEVLNFAILLIEGVVKNLPHIDAVIKKYVKNWEIERLALIDRNILRLACFELLFLDDIPPKVSINEAIELGKRFGDIESSKFINGVLDKIYKLESKKAEPKDNASIVEKPNQI